MMRRELRVQLCEKCALWVGRGNCLRAGTCSSKRRGHTRLQRNSQTSKNEGRQGPEQKEGRHGWGQTSLREIQVESRQGSGQDRKGLLHARVRAGKGEGRQEARAETGK